MFGEFKKFIMRGNVLDLAIGVIIGTAFGKIVASLVGDILNPIIGLALGKIDFSNLFVALNGQTYATIAVRRASMPSRARQSIPAATSAASRAASAVWGLAATRCSNCLRHTRE